VARLVLLLSVCLLFSSLAAQQDTTTVVVKDIVIEGNKRTKPWFIERESGIARGDVILRDELDASMQQVQNNVNNLGLFNIVSVTPVVLPDNGVLVLIELTERWYFYPSPILKFAEPNFNVWWKNKDFSRTNYGIELDLDNFRGRGEELEVKVQLGFSRKLALEYTIPYISKENKWGLGLLASYSENEEFNIGTFNNQRLFFSEGDGDARNEQSYEAKMTNRPNVFTTHSFGLQYKKVAIADSLLSFRQDHLVTGTNKMNYFLFEYSYSYRDVDRASYPLKGRRFDTFLRKSGLGLTGTRPDVWTIRATARNYMKLKGRFYLHSMLSLNTTEGKQIPYYIQQGLGYGNNSVRGYEFYVMDGQRYALMRNNLKFEILPWRARTLKFIKSTKFNSFQYALYFNLIGDLGYVQDELYAKENPRNNELLGGVGAGLDLLLSYDVSMRVEFMRNRLGEDGIYFHFRRSF